MIQPLGVKYKCIDLTRMECKDIELVIGMLDAISIDLTRMECKG